MQARAGIQQITDLGRISPWLILPPASQRMWWVYLPPLLAASPLGEAARWDHAGWQLCDFLILSDWWRKQGGVKQGHYYPCICWQGWWYKLWGFDFLGQLARRPNAMRKEWWEQAHRIVGKPKGFYGRLSFLHTKKQVGITNWKSAAGLNAQNPAVRKAGCWQGLSTPGGEKP